MPHDLEHSRACYDRGAWDEAYETLRLADRTTPLDRDDLQRLGISAFLIGRDLEFERSCSAVSPRSRTRGSHADYAWSRTSTASSKATCCCPAASGSSEKETPPR